MHFYIITTKGRDNNGEPKRGVHVIQAARLKEAKKTVKAEFVKNGTNESVTNVTRLYKSGSRSRTQKVLFSQF